MGWRQRISPWGFAIYAVNEELWFSSDPQGVAAGQRDPDQNRQNELAEKNPGKKCEPNSSDALRTGFFLLVGASGSSPGRLAGREAAV